MKKRYERPIPIDNDLIKQIVQAIEDAEYLYQEYVDEEQFPTNNGENAYRWNYINKELKKTIQGSRYQIDVTNSGIWKFLLVYDRETKYLYTFMRDKNLLSLRKHSSSKIYHYVNVLSRLNKNLGNEYQIINEQLSFLPDVMDIKETEKKLDNMLEKKIRNIDGRIECYVLVAFDISHGHVTDIKGIIPWEGMEYFYEEDWKDVLTAQYNEDLSKGEVEVPEIIIPLKRRLDKINIHRKKKDTNIEKKE